MYHKINYRRYEWKHVSRCISKGVCRKSNYLRLVFRHIFAGCCSFINPSEEIGEEMSPDASSEIAAAKLVGDFSLPLFHNDYRCV